MRRKLFVIEEVAYTVSGRLVLAGRVEKESLDFKDNDSVIIVLPNGTEIKTKVEGSGRFKIQKTFVHSIIADDLTRDDIPIGSTVFINE